MQESIQLKDIEPNPYRGLESYPIQRKKVDHLKESVQTTGLWNRLTGRRRKNKVQLAFGHHLKTALDELYSSSHKIPIEVRELSDEQMFQMMARENMSDWDSTPVQDLLTVKELLAACERGEIHLPEGKIKSTVKRFQRARTTGEEISKFLGWDSHDKTSWIVEALDLLDAKLLKQSELEGLTDTQVRELIREIGRQRKWAEQQAREAEEWAEQAKKEEEEATSDADKKEAKQTYDYARQKAQIHREHAKMATRTIINEVGSELRAGTLGTRQVRSRAFEAVPPPFPKPKDVPPINQFADQLATELNRVLSKSDPHREKLLAVADNQEHLSAYAREMLLGALESLSERVSHWVSRLDPKQNNGSRTPVKSAGPRRLKV